MAVTNTGYDQGKEKKEKATGEKKIYRSTGNYTPRTEGKSYAAGDGNRRKDYQGNADSKEKRENRENKGGYKGNQNGFRSNQAGQSGGQGGFKGNQSGTNRTGQGGYKPNNRSYDKGFDFKDKDDEDDVRKPRPKAQTSSKPKEQQSDKIEIMNRLEREKKAVKKKQAESSKKENRPKVHAKPKRAGNIDWTKAYENDEYDDDDFDMYM